MRQNSSGIKIICLFILYFPFVLADFLFTHPDPGLYVRSARTYNDSSILLHMGKRKLNVNDVSLDDHFIIRILHSSFEINQFEISDEEIKEAENVFVLTNEYVLLTYYRMNDDTRHGMIYDRSGEILPKTKGLVLGGSKNSSFSDVIVNINPEVGFLWLTDESDGYDHRNITWIVFSMPIDGNVTEFRKDTISSEGEEWKECKALPTVDGGYVVVFIGQNTGQPNVPNNTIILEPTWTVYATFLKYQSYERMKQILIYQTSLDLDDMKFRECNLEFDNGFICIISASSLKNSAKSGEFVISFLSSGSVIGVNQLKIDNEILSGREFNVVGTVSLIYGGFAIILQNDEKFIACESLNGQTSFTYCINLQYKFQRLFEVELIYGLLSNNTDNSNNNNSLWIVQNEVEDKWSIYFFDLLPFVTDVNGYENPYIDSTFPTKDGKIDMGATEININFNVPVALSLNSISIYQVNETQDILRQKTPATNSEYVYLSNNNLTVNVVTLSSTFNMPEKYYILMDNNFVKNKENNEPKIGIKKNKWEFTAIQSNEFKNAESAIASVRLNKGFDFDKNLTDDFFMNLQHKLCQIIPVDEKKEQLKFTKKYRKDFSTSQIQIQLGLKIDAKHDGRNVESIIEDLDKLIKEQEITQISMVEPAFYLDKAYGCKLERIIEQLAITAAYLIAFLAISFLGYFAAKWWCKNKNGKDPKMCQNSIIFSIILIINDVVFDILFLINNSNEVGLFVPR